MSIKADAPPPAVGVYWIDEADYSTLRDLFEDGNKMPPTWKEWLKMAEEMKRGLESFPGTPSCGFASIHGPFQIGVLPKAQDRAAKHESDLLLRPSKSDTATKTRA